MGSTGVDARNFQRIEALFNAALERRPKDHDARLFAGISAYWSRQPDVALTHLNALLDAAPQRLRRRSAAACEEDRPTRYSANSAPAHGYRAAG
jgi:cytochrome c-type biogenesis protein CcmH/NrfG